MRHSRAAVAAAARPFCNASTGMQRSGEVQGGRTAPSTFRPPREILGAAGNESADLKRGNRMKTVNF